ncbi:N-acetylmuramoyl-L-alanine amidase [gut metagenome]|uniref:N-acetylmuramoyl-L-alanine amidase n=1 Tax=gut metagenome TaxID=749906 RepID=J9H539_9ZZZZ
MKYYQNLRNIAFIVVHCSATREDRDFPVEALRRCHIEERGFANIGYHFYITRDGITHACRPLDRIGAHCRGFNDHSIGVCYEGGLDVHGRPADTRTMAQKIALIALLRELHKDYPQAYIRGHRDLATSLHKVCPCFDAADEYAEFQPDDERPCDDDE